VEYRGWVFGSGIEFFRGSDIRGHQAVAGNLKPEREVIVFEAKEILDLAIQLEKNGEAVYRQAIQTVTDGELRAMLDWMAGEEVSHGQWFSTLKTSLDQGSPSPFHEEMSRQLIEELVGGQSFSLKEVDFSKVAGPDELISIFIEFEKDTILFYEMIAPFVEHSATRTHLESIIAEEHRHIARLKQFQEKGTKAAVEVR
jgi:rubrerythrin